MVVSAAMRLIRTGRDNGGRQRAGQRWRDAVAPRQLRKLQPQLHRQATAHFLPRVLSARKFVANGLQPSGKLGHSGCVLAIERGQIVGALEFGEVRRQRGALGAAFRNRRRVETSPFESRVCDRQPSRFSPA
jgi:hypothetical protein